MLKKVSDPINRLVLKTLQTYTKPFKSQSLPSKRHFLALVSNHPEAPSQHHGYCPSSGSSPPAGGADPVGLERPLPAELMWLTQPKWRVNPKDDTASVSAEILLASLRRSVPGSEYRRKSEIRRTATRILWNNKHIVHYSNQQFHKFWLGTQSDHNLCSCTFTCMHGKIHVATLHETAYNSTWPKRIKKTIAFAVTITRHITSNKGDNISNASS